MDETYSDCELKYMDQGYDLEMARQKCSSEGRSSDEESESSRKDEDYDFWGEV